MDVDVEGEGTGTGLKGLLEEDDQALSLSAFETLEKEFQDVLATLAGDESLDEFRAEYEKVHRALVRSHVRSRRPTSVPSLPYDSCPSHDAGGGFFFAEEAVRTTSGPSRRVRETAFMKMASSRDRGASTPLL